MIDTLSRIKTSFDSTCDTFAKEFDKRPTLYKTSLVVSHIFRSIMMYGLMSLSPFFTFGVVLPLSLLYRVTIERFCAFRFALPSLVGGAALIFSQYSIFGYISLAAYIGLVTYISHKDIENYIKSEKKCCKRP